MMLASCPCLQDLEFGVDCDSRVALVGPNGAGGATAKLAPCHALACL